tara:strand:+ start:1167 stop:1520 length:354 start_codon:yes stop_codon:yes gene_type:complete
MTTQNLVFKSLFKKEELSSYKIELGLLDDIKSDFNFIDKDFGGIYDSFWDYIESAKNKQSLIKSDLPRLDLIEKNIVQATQKLKDLGLDNQIGELSKISDKIKKYKSDINRVLTFKI